MHYAALRVRHFDSPQPVHLVPRQEVAGTVLVKEVVRVQRVHAQPAVDRGVPVGLTLNAGFSAAVERRAPTTGFACDQVPTAVGENRIFQMPFPS